MRAAHQKGEHPARLVLGHEEAESLRRYVIENFDVPVPRHLRDTYYLGLKVEENNREHDLHLEGEKPHPDTAHELAPLIDHAPHQPDFRVPSERQFFHHWDSASLRQLIDEKTAADRKPAFLFLGHHETFLLRRHLGAAFGPEAVRTLKNLYYMGLEVIEVDTDYFLRTAGMKRIKSFKSKAGRKPKWKDINESAFWQFQLE
ncbi:MAG: hypothetical protein AAGC74_03720 [Verrucomicrobiota bacterium]